MRNGYRKPQEGILRRTGKDIVSPLPRPPHFTLPCSTDDKILSNCPPTPPLTQRQSTDNNFRVNVWLREE